MRIVYVGDTDAAIANLLVEIDEESVSVFATNNAGNAIDRLLRSPCEWLIVDQSFDAGKRTAFLEHARTIGEAFNVAYRGDPADLSDQIEGEIDRVLSNGRIDPAELDVEMSRRPLNETDEPSDVISALRRTNGAIARIDDDGTYRWVNREMADRLGVAKDEIEGQLTIEEHPPSEQDTDLLELGRSAITSQSAKRTFATVDGEFHQYLALPVTDDSFVLDEREFGELITQGSPSDPGPQFVRTVLDQIDDIFFVTDFQGNLVQWNHRLNEVTGYSDEEIDSLHAVEFFPERDRPTVMESLAKVQQEGDRKAELNLSTKDGETIPYEFTGSLIEKSDGTGFVSGIGRDISRRVTAERELRQTVRKLEQSNDELEKFAYVASHDLREPLRTVRSYLDLLQRRYGDELDEDAIQLIGTAIDGSERMQEMIGKLLDYSRVGSEMEIESVDTESVLRETVGNLQSAIIGSKARIRSEPLPTVTGDRGMLVQLFQNLLSNAIEYSGDGIPRVEISAERREDVHQFSIEDCGVGMTENEQDGIFDLFSSGYSDSYGIGLATCEKIVEYHGGGIWVESEKGVGTAFHLTLPSADCDLEVERGTTPLAPVTDPGGRPTE